MIPIRYFALIALLIAVPVSSWYIAYQPMNEAAEETAVEIRARSNQLTKFSRINNQHRELRALSKTLSEALGETIKRIPAEANAEQWLQSASDAAKSLGLVVRSVTTSGERTAGKYTILPVDLNLNGSYASVYQLIQHFERMDRIVRVDRMAIQRINDEQVDARLVIHLVFGSGGVS